VLTTISPNKLFDAFAAGLPTVNVTEGWIKGLFEEAQCGLNVPTGSSRLLADAVVRLADDEALRRRLGDNARRLARDVYDRDLLAHRMLAQLLAAAGSAASPPQR